MSASSSSPSPADVLIVGAGIAGAAVARVIRDAEPHVSITMIDAGPGVGAVSGQHLHDVAEPELWQEYNVRQSLDSQAAYIGPEMRARAEGPIEALPAGVYGVGAFGEESEQFPAAAIAWNLGGMGVHWTSSCPIPGGDEAFPYLGAEQWAADRDRALELLQVSENPYGETPSGQMIQRVLHENFDEVSASDRLATYMPTAVEPRSDAPWSRTGPNRIFPAIARDDDTAFHLVSGAIATRLLLEGTRVTGVEVRDVASGQVQVLRADRIVVAADALRTPQLLFASGIRPAALGRYLNEHAFLDGWTAPDFERLGLDPADVPEMREAEARAGNHWLPHNDGQQPHHLQVTESYRGDSRAPEDYLIMLTVYVRTALDADNRVEFDETETDLAGLPRMRFHYRRTDSDLEAIASGIAFTEKVGRLFGDFDFDEAGGLGDPGASLHYTGTVRMGTVDDGTSVCDPDARVWGIDNLYLAGNGVVPTALLGNATPAGVITAVRAGTAVVEGLRAEKNAA